MKTFVLFLTSAVAITMGYAALAVSMGIFHTADVRWMQCSVMHTIILAIAAAFGYEAIEGVMRVSCTCMVVATVASCFILVPPPWPFLATALVCLAWALLAMMRKLVR